jgi:hypothetical protein
MDPEVPVKFIGVALLAAAVKRMMLIIKTPTTLI